MHEIVEALLILALPSQTGKAYRCHRQFRESKRGELWLFSLLAHQVVQPRLEARLMIAKQKQLKILCKQSEQHKCQVTTWSIIAISPYRAMINKHADTPQAVSVPITFMRTHKEQLFCLACCVYTHEMSAFVQHCWQGHAETSSSFAHQSFAQTSICCAHISSLQPMSPPRCPCILSLATCHGLMTNDKAKSLWIASRLMSPLLQTASFQVV